MRSRFKGLRATVRKDLLRTRRAPGAVLIFLAFPVIIALLATFAFGGAEPRLPKVDLLIEDRDDALLGRLILLLAQGGPAAEIFDVERIETGGRERMEKGEASALLVLPEGLSESFLAGRPVELSLVRNPSQGILPEVAEQAALLLTDTLSTASQVLREPLSRIDGVLLEGDGPTEAEVALIAVAVQRALEGGERFLLPPAITVEKTSLEVDDDTPAWVRESGGIFVVILPGLAVFALFLIGDRAMRDIYTEQEDGTLVRQLAAPITTSTLVLGKVIYGAILAGVCLLVLMVVAWAVVPAIRVDPLGLLALFGALVLAVTGTTAAIYGIARNARQAGTSASLIFVIMAFLGGSFVPTESMPEVLRQFAPYSLFYWAIQGFRDLLVQNAGVAELSLPLSVLTAAGLLGLIVGSFFLSRRLIGSLA